MPPAPDAKKKLSKERLRNVAPLLGELVRPRRGLLLGGLLLVVVNRVAGLVLPYSSKFIIQQVVQQRQISLLKFIVLAEIGRAHV